MTEWVCKRRRREGCSSFSLTVVTESSQVTAQCRTLGDSASPDVPPMLRKAAVALRSRTVLLQYTAEEVATIRHNALFRRFITALTRGGVGGTPRPIEMHAHDPWRYIG